MESIVVTSHRKSFSTDNVNEGTDLKSPKPSSNNGSLVGTEESPRLLSPRDPTHRHHIMDDKTKSLITFLEKTKRPSQRVTTSHAMVMAAKRRALLTNCNKRYGKKIEILESCRRPTIGFSDDLIQQSLQISFDAMKQTEEIMKENIFEMNQFFSEMSPKKILRMYDTELIQYLYVNGSTTEGIFRICGNQDTIQKIKTKLECNEKNFFSSFDIYSLASTLKQYIREFPSQVISPDIDREFLDLYKHSYSIGKSEMADDQILEEYLRIFAKLPPIIKDFIENLTKLLSQVLQHASTNKMNLANIFICLGPALRGCPFCFNYATVHHSEIFCSTKQQEETKESIKEEKKEGEENNNSIPQ
ncbi:RhoGAP domain containing protein [Entamoeba histolytica HM-1:IMSS-B]|uniref:RhoGAP domain containing protein n=1 Tax=Entamoeba histolytica HM-1:IMSS-B TaxID=885319 RepID=M3RZZ6_ENTH1|nr:RhoGAP domain containing protein [Entamoeba histolytica HM-1:IMSS-B]